MHRRNEALTTSRHNPQIDLRSMASRRPAKYGARVTIHGISARAFGASICMRCGAATRFRARYCGECKEVIASATSQFRRDIYPMLNAGAGPLDPNWERIVSAATQSGVQLADLLLAVAPESAEWLRRYVAFATADDVVTPEEMRGFEYACQRLIVAPQVAAELKSHMEREFQLTGLRLGHLPVFTPTDVHLGFDERCHLDVRATRWRQLKSGQQDTVGRLLLTSRKLRFIAPSHALEARWGRVLKVTTNGRNQIQLQSATASINATLEVPDPVWAATTIDTLIRLDRRQLLPSQEGRDTRTIPQHVKTAVWQRDSGRCRQCGSGSYLEFDHVIPLALGGATSEGNLQLLCRGCNSQKGHRL